MTGERLGCCAVHADPDAVVEALAARQRRVVSYRQLRAAGLTRSAIGHRVASGRLHRVRRGVYLAGHADALPLALETAALLACGPPSALDHDTAAAIWGFRPAAQGPIHVLVAGRCPGTRPGIRIHRTHAIGEHDACVRDGLVLTTPARTLISLAATLGERDLRWAVEDARVRRLVTIPELDRRLTRFPRHRGTAALRRIVAASRGAPRFTRAESERLLLDLLRAARLPEPATNVRVHGFEVDAFWRDRGLVVEVDGFGTHGSREAFERDRHRDATLQAHGLRVARFSWRQVTEQREATIALLARLLERGAGDAPASSGPRS